jgi:hypothetical protein
MSFLFGVLACIVLAGIAASLPRTIWLSIKGRRNADDASEGVGSEGAAEAGKSDSPDRGMLMNDRQRICLIIGGVLLILALVVVPWRVTYTTSRMNGAQFVSYGNLGYGLAFSPPDAGAFGLVQVDVARLLIGVALVAIVTAVGVFVCGMQKKR